MFNLVIQERIEKLEESRSTWNISRETIEFIVNSLFFEKINVLEIGTFNGYSALWFAKVADKVVSLEIDEKRVKESKKNLEDLDNVKVVLGDAKEVIPRLNEKFNVVLIDAMKKEYGAYLELVLDKLEDDFLIFVDNTISHGEKISSLFEILKKHPKLRWKELGIGKGLIVIGKN